MPAQSSKLKAQRFKDKKYLRLCFQLSAFSFLLFCGCINFRSKQNSGQLQSYPTPVIEAAWIRNGEPIEFEGQQWFPVRDVENLMDTEVYQIGEYKDVQMFVDKVDIKPYERIYTKFCKGKYRYFTRANND